MSNTLDKLKVEHPEWCFRCGAEKPFANHHCEPYAPLVLLVAAAEEVEKMADGDAYLSLQALYIEQLREQKKFRAQLAAAEKRVAVLESALKDHFAGRCSMAPLKGGSDAEV